MAGFAALAEVCSWAFESLAPIRPSNKKWFNTYGPRDLRSGHGPWLTYSAAVNYLSRPDTIDNDLFFDQSSLDLWKDDAGYHYEHGDESCHHNLESMSSSPSMDSLSNHLPPSLPRPRG